MKENERPEVDLFKTPCPHGLVVEIEGKGRFAVEIPSINLITGIAHVLTLLTRRRIFVDEFFASRITILELNQKSRFIKVRIAGE